jgi:tRNA threonylcarbamoyladenosine biosynthesis protein TsaE
VTATVATRSPGETVQVGRRLAALLRPGDLVVLTGPLGAGKTALTRGIGEGLGVRGAVTSPTFVPARGGRVPLVHVDAYRLRGPDGALPDLDALEDLDLSAALEESVVVVEWGDGLAEALGQDHLTVRLARPEGTAGDEGDRTLHVGGHGARWEGTDLEAALRG